MTVDEDAVRRLVRVEVNDLIRSGGLPVSATRTPNAMGTISGATVSIALNTTTTVSWDGPELFDQFEVHSPVTNPDRFVCPDGGLYLVAAQLVWEPSNVGSRHAFILLNGSIVARSATQPSNLGALNWGMQVFVLRQVQKGAFFQIQVRSQSSGVAQNLFGGVPGPNGSWAAAVRLA